MKFKFKFYLNKITANLEEIKRAVIDGSWEKFEIWFEDEDEHNIWHLLVYSLYQLSSNMMLKSKSDRIEDKEYGNFIIECYQNAISTDQVDVTNDDLNAIIVTIKRLFHCGEQLLSMRYLSVLYTGILNRLKYHIKNDIERDEKTDYLSELLYIIMEHRKFSEELYIKFNA